MLSDRGRKTLREARNPFQIEDPDLARSLKAVGPHLPRDHHRWAFPVGVVLAVVLTVPGPSTLKEVEIAARKRPPLPRIRRNATTFPVSRPSPSEQGGSLMTSPDSSDLTQDRTDSATCREAAIVPRGQRLMASTARRTTLALGQLLNAVSLALATDGRSAPPTVRRAASRVADQLQCSRSASSSSGVAADDDRIGPSGRLSAHRQRSGPRTICGRPVPYTSSIKLGRMG
ncbi:MAG: hypothetical protein ACRDSI_15615 [Pseudonocardiaceae bacterium]